MPEGGTIPLARSGSGRGPARGRPDLRPARPRGALRRDGQRRHRRRGPRRGRQRHARRPRRLAARPRLAAPGRDLASPARSPGSSPAAPRVARGLRGGARRRRRRRSSSRRARSVGAIAAHDAELAEAIELLRPARGPAPAHRAARRPAARRGRGGRAASCAPPPGRSPKRCPQVNRLLALGRRDPHRDRTGSPRRSTRCSPPRRRCSPPCARRSPRSSRCSARCAGSSTPSPRTRRTSSSPARGSSPRPSNSIPVGQTAPGNPALRFAPVLTCHRARDPYPEPGETLEHSEPC